MVQPVLSVFRYAIAYYGTALPPERKPIPLLNPDDRIGEPYLRCPLEKVLAVVETDAPDRNSPFSPPDQTSRQIAGHLLDFLAHEIKRGRLGPRLLPLQSGVGNIPNAVLAGLAAGGYQDLSAFTEVIQDGMLMLLKEGVLRVASATSFSLSPVGIEAFYRDLAFYRSRIVLRPQ